jgi:putative oxidoreductase
MIDWAVLILRIGLGILFPFHGWMKLNPNGPVKGPAGFAAWLQQMRVPLPRFFGWIVPLLETAGAALLVLGLGTRVVALGFVIDMFMAIQLAKRAMMKKRFMEPDGTGWEFEFVVLVAAAALVVGGGGGFAVDRVIGLF